MIEDVLGSLPADARAQVDAYLDAVERALRDGGVDRAGRRGITDDIELHLRDTLARTPEPRDAAAIARLIATLDAPATYAAPTGDATAPTVPLPPTRPAAAPSPGPTGLWWLVASLLAVVFLFFGLFGVRVAGPPKSWATVFTARSVAVVAMSLLLAGALLATARGWSSLAAIGRGERPRRQIAAATLSAIAWPLLIAWPLMAIAMQYVVPAFYDGPTNSDRGVAIQLLLDIPAGLAIAAGFIFAALRVARGRRDAVLVIA